MNDSNISLNTDVTERSSGIVPVFLKNKNPTFLLIQQHQGHWGFPKGHIEKGESVLSAALRELSEEVGVSQVAILSDSPYIDSYDIERDGIISKKIVAYFLGSITNTQKITAQDSEVIDFVWLTYEKALERATYDGSKNALIALSKHLEYKEK